MQVKMIALRRHYDKDLSREFLSGQAFQVKSQARADMLVRIGRAKIAVPPAMQPAPRPAASPAPAPSTALSAASESDNATPRGRYLRRDMRPENEAE